MLGQRRALGHVGAGSGHGHAFRAGREGTGGRFDLLGRYGSTSGDVLQRERLDGGLDVVQAVYVLLAERLVVQILV